MNSTVNPQAKGEKKKGRTRNSLTPFKSVPVLSRELKEDEPKPKKRPRTKLKTGHIGALVFVVLLMLIVIAVPLRNYFAGRAEIARLEQSIATKQARKASIEDEIKRYGDDNFLKEQARLRLGLIEPGETSFRIIDPKMGNADTVTTTRTEVEEEKNWREILWDSLSTPPSDQETSGSADAPTANLPIAPADGAAGGGAADGGAADGGAADGAAPDEGEPGNGAATPPVG